MASFLWVGWGGGGGQRRLFGGGPVDLSSETQGYDAEQARLMEERVIEVDENDKPLRPASKLETHLNKFGPILHRAFSVFLFDPQGRMLLQKRAPAKITFPSYWTNTCCSHPLWTPQEMGDDVQDPVLGCKRAAIRKLDHELGIPSSSLSPQDLTYMTRIHYIANSDEKWGEHEIDYVFLIQKELPLSLNENEVCEVKYVQPDELRRMMEEADGGKLKLTPWSRAIMDRFLFDWWRDLPQMKPPASDIIHKIGQVG